MFGDELLLPWLARMRSEVPELDVIDVHTHIGQNDPDGYRCTPEQLAAGLELADARGVVFPMHEPSGYPPANDRVIAAAEASGGRLVAFARLDPARDPAREADRCLAAGARGLKLHPRAEDFTLDHPALLDVFALANDQAVPIICHAGRGIPALGRHAVELCERFPRARLILAHAGICDLAWIWRDSARLPNLFFDTAWWSTSDLLSLLCLVPPGQILFGSDAPYGTPVFHLTLMLRYAAQAGLSADQVRLIAGGQTARLLEWDDPVDGGPPPGTAALSQDALLDRVHTYLVSAVSQMFSGIEPTEALALAVLACEVGDDAPQAPICRSILAVLEERRRYAGSPRDDGRPERFAPGIHLVLFAAGLARTPDVPLPAEPVAVDVGEREAPTSG